MTSNLLYTESNLNIGCMVAVFWGILYKEKNILFACTTELDAFLTIFIENIFL